MWNKLRFSASSAKEFSYAFISQMSWVLVGISRSYPAFLFAQLGSNDSAITISNEEKSWIASITFLFTPLGCLISGLLMDMFGRKICVLCIYLPFVISWLLIGFAKNILVLYIAMVISGIAGGMSFCVSTYISEISIAEHRGGLLSIIEITYSIGILLSNVLMCYLEWNVVAFIFAGCSAVCLLLTLFITESPIWLLLKGKTDKSIRALCSLRCKEPSQLVFEIKDMQDACDLLKKRNFRNNVKMMMKSWKPFAILVCLFCCVQNMGHTLLLSYMLMIFDSLKIPYDSQKIAIVYSTVLCVASVVVPFFMNRIGRRVILAVSAFGMGVSMVVAAVHEEIYLYDDVKPYAWIVPAALYSYSFFSAVGVIPVVFIMGGELFPREVSGAMNGLYGSAGYVYSAAIFKAYPTFLTNFGVKVSLWMSASFGVFVGFYAILILPETRGKTLNEIQKEYFKKKKNFFV